jgi:hypothetical protein
LGKSSHDNAARISLVSMSCSKTLPFDNFIYSSHKCPILVSLFIFLSTAIVRTVLFVITAPFSCRIEVTQKKP